MENRDRDKVSRNTSDDSDAELGQNIGGSEDLNEPNRRSGNVDDSGMKGSSDEKESWQDESSSNIGDNVSDRNSGRTSDSSRSEH